MTSPCPAVSRLFSIPGSVRVKNIMKTGNIDRPFSSVKVKGGTCYEKTDHIDHGAILYHHTIRLRRRRQRRAHRRRSDGHISGVVTDRFIEGSGADTADVLAVDTGSGETVYFTIIDSTQFIGAEDVSVGDNVEVQCEEYSDSSYRPIRSLQAAEASAPQPAETQENTGTVANLSMQQSTADLSPEDADLIAELVEYGSWTGALSDCASDCVLTINTESFLYHSDCGTFKTISTGKA